MGRCLTRLVNHPQGRCLTNLVHHPQEVGQGFAGAWVAVSLGWSIPWEGLGVVGFLLLVNHPPGVGGPSSRRGLEGCII